MGIRGTEDDGESRVGHSISPKGVQPRVVLALLLGGSFAGIWLSHWGEPTVIRVFWWVFVVGSGLLAGGLYWRLALYDETLFDDTGIAREVRRRWERFEATAVWVLALCGVGSLGLSIAIEAVGLAAGFVLAPILWLGIRRGGVGAVSRQTTSLRSLLFLVVLVSLGSFAWIETGTGVVDWLVRVGHVGSFALWLGGAVWHNGIVLPTLRSHPTAVDALKTQARRFRRHLAVIIPLFFVTGGYQALRFGVLSPQSLLNSPIGRLVGFKLLVLVALTGLVLTKLKRASCGARETPQ